MNDFNGYDKLSVERVRNIAALVETSESEIEDWLYADWSNAEDHNKWMNSAPDEEIASWISSCIR